MNKTHLINTCPGIKNWCKRFGTKVLLVLCLGFVLPLGAIAQVNETFSDGDFTNNPAWAGDTANFEVIGFQLHLNAPAVTDISALSTPSQSILNATWEFYTFLNFGTSSSNYARFYLVSDNDSLQNAVNGYYVKIGNTNDEVSLYRQDGTTDLEILDGKDGRVGTPTVTARIKVTRDNLGNWEVFVDSTGGTNFISEGTVFDDTYSTSDHVGVSCYYTSTRSNQFYFDSVQVTGGFVVDTVGPFVSSVIPSSDTSLEVYFNENVDQTTAENTGNYLVNNGIGVPVTATLDASNGKLVHLTFSTSFTQGSNYTIAVDNVQDLKGNPGTNNQYVFTYFIPGYRDVVINEIFADPSPVIGLPSIEYVELYNPTTATIELGGMTFTDGSGSATLPAYALLPNALLILCVQGGDTAFTSLGPTLGLAGFPSLNNSGDNLKLLMSDGSVMDEVNYSDAWYNDPIKDDGGYSLELIDPETPCSGEGNWSASVDPSGGTPGRVNSIKASNPDLEAPLLQSAVTINDSMVLVYFDENIEPSTVMLSNISIDNGIIVSSHAVGTIPDRDTLWLTSKLQAKTVYTVTYSNVTDCSGNMMSGNNSSTFALPEAPEPNDLIINEVLFNPRSGAVDFVEIYNNSDKHIDMREVFFIKSDTGGYAKYTIAADYSIIAPAEYRVYTEDPAIVASEYPLGKSEYFYDIPDLPTYNDSEGEVIIGYSSLVYGMTVLDSFYYTDKMHFELIDDVNGVSLERIDFNQSTADNENWHSAAGSVGYATPGYLNSQSRVVSGMAGQITVEPDVFTPDDDGYNDFTTISYDFETGGNVANITIFDSHGRLVKNLARNELLGTRGFYQWNGIKEDSRKALVGNYIILFEIFDANGNKEKFKKIVAVGTQF